MKKLILVTAILFCFALITNNLSAQTQEKTEKATVKTEQTQTASGKYVDNNKNGVCDNHENKAGKVGKCGSFVDKNNDGVCDKKGENCKAKSECKGQNKGNCGKGNGNGHQYRNGCGNGNGCGKGKQ